MCSSDLPSALKDWLFTLGFDNQTVSDTQIESEFQRLTPPEMRDVWRHMMTHVVPVQNKRYIKKVLLLHELKKQHSKRGGNRPLPKNLTSVTELESYVCHEKTLQQLHARELSIQDKRAKIEELRKTYSELKEKRKSLVEKKDMANHILTLLRLKTERYSSLNEELDSIRECLNYVGSHLWNAPETKENSQPMEEVMKRLIERVHEFGIRRHELGTEELISEQRKLQETIVTFTMNVAPSALQKEVIKLLENTLLKLTEYVKEKHQETNNYGDFEWNLPGLKKQCVRTYADNHDLQIAVKAQEKKNQEKISQLIENFEQLCKDENEKTIRRNWLDIELLKCRMKSRHKFLSKMEEIASREIGPAFTSDVERKKFIKPILDMNDQMIDLEKEINSNLRYLSNKSVDLFVNYQQMCKSKMEKFVQLEKSLDCNVFIEHPDFLKTEIDLLRTLTNYSHSTNGIHDDVPNMNIVEYTRRTNFSLYLECAYKDFVRRVSHLNYPKAVLDETISKVKVSEEEFQSLMRKYLEEAKNNLKLTEKEMDTCSKNVKLWTDFSVDELIPEHMVVEKYTFQQWKERYRACMYNLSKFGCADGTMNSNI